MLSPRRMIRAGSTESSARGSVVAMTDTWWSISSTSPRDVARREVLQLRVGGQLEEVALEVRAGVLVGL